MKPLYNYDFTLHLTSTGENEVDAYDAAMSALMEEYMGKEQPFVPYSFTKYSEPAIDTTHLVCSICGEEEEVRMDDFGEWAPEVYLGGEDLGPCCPNCLVQYCEHDEDGMAQVLLNEVSFQEGQCRSLLPVIVKLINRLK